MRPPDLRNNIDRLIARALRDEQDEPPEDFASQTAAFVLREHAHGLGDRLELWLQRAVLGVLIGSTGVTLFRMGGRVFAPLASIDGTGWIYTATACFVLSLGIQYVMQRRERRS
jgi:hypothetical protein